MDNHQLVSLTNAAICAEKEKELIIKEPNLDEMVDDERRGQQKGL